MFFLACLTLRGCVTLAAPLGGGGHGGHGGVSRGGRVEPTVSERGRGVPAGPQLLPRAPAPPVPKTGAVTSSDVMGWGSPTLPLSLGQA